MDPSSASGPEVGIGLLLSGSDAFRYLAMELAAVSERWEGAGADPATVAWARRLAEHAGWWCGRLEGEADAVFARDDGMTPRPGACRRRRGRHGA